MEDKYRINISKFRCRYNHLPFSIKYSLDYDCDIRCKLCLQNDIGDEYHYLIRFDYFLHERQLFINKYFIQHPSCIINLSNSFRQRTPKTELI